MSRFGDEDGQGERSGGRSGGRFGGGSRGGFGGGRSGGRFGGGSRGGFGNRPRRFNDGPREMHKAKCTECGNECEVPFKPTEGKPVYCNDCFKNHRKF